VPAHVATALATDRDGFLWIGTQRGLARWDGYTFRVFRADPDDVRALPGSYVRSLLAARDGRLWVGTFASGLAVYDPSTETFARFAHDGADAASLSHDRIEGLAEDVSGRIWVATYGGLDRLEPATGRIEHFRHRAADPSSLADDRVRSLLVDRRGTLWVGSRDGLQRWRGDGKGFERIASTAGDAGSLAGQFVSRLFEDHRGRIWIGTNDDGAAVCEPATGRLHRFLPRPRDPDGLSHFWVYGIAEVVPGEIWIATFGGGVDVVDGESLAIVARLRHDPSLPSTIGSDRVGALLRDGSGQVWVATWGQGITRHHPATRAFVTVRFAPNDSLGLTHPAAVRPLARRDGTIWVGTNGNGIDVFDAALRRVDGFRPDAADPGALSDGAVTSLVEGPDGSAWVATLDGDLHRLRPGSRRFERLTPRDGLAGGPIRALTFGPDGGLWAGAAEGLTRIDPPTMRAERVVRRRRSDGASLPPAAVEAVAFLADGTMWLGTDSGLEVVEPRSGAAVRVVRKAGAPDQLPSNWVPDLMVARDGRLWVGTQGGACVVEGWNGVELRCVAVSERIHRATGPAESLIEDDAGRVWIGPTLRVDPATWRAEELGAADGCDLRTFFIASRARTRDGSLLFGSPEGLLVVRPDRLVPWNFAPPVVATGLRVDGIDRPGRTLGPLRLSPPRRSVELDFAALDLSDPARVAYRYRLEGFDGAWRTADASHRSLAYTNLRPGRYTLHVRATNRAGVWSPFELRLPVVAVPAFWETRWFAVAVGVALVLLAYGAFRLRVRRLEARALELETQVADRTRALAAKNEELAAAYVRIEEASLTDPLTGLRNRRFVEQAIEGDLEVALRRHREGEGGGGQGDLVVLLLDLDHFKRVNDTYGHAAGDAVLVQMAAVLRGVFRAADIVARWGGEEFLVVARFVDRARGAELAEKVRAEVAAHAFTLPDGTSLRKTCSVGFAVYPFAVRDPVPVGWERVVHAADLALYVAKRRGRDCWVGVAPAGGRDGDRALASLEVDAEGAVSEGSVVLSSSRGGATDAG